MVRIKKSEAKIAWVPIAVAVATAVLNQLGENQGKPKK